MEEVKNQKKHRLNRHIPPHHKEKVAAGTIFILLLALCALFSLGASITDMYWRASHKPKVSTSHTQDTDPVNFAVSSITSSSSDGDQAFTPAPGNHYVVVDVDMVHYFDAPTWFSPVNDSYIKDSSDKHYTMSPLSLSSPFDARSYKSGEHATGQLSYQLPKTTTNLEWCYKVANHHILVCKKL